LVASCPCALSLALPVVHAAASRRLLDEGILLTRGDALHALNEVDTAIFDKTGTLTLGTPEIDSIEVNAQRPEFGAARALQIAAVMEGVSAHPIARAFQSAEGALAERKATPRLDGPVVVRPGLGLEARIDNTRWRIGTAGFAAAGAGGSDDDAIWLADARGWVARFELRDSLRPGAAEAIDSLREGGVDVRIVSGDGRGAVAAAAERLGIADFLARQTPEMKLDALRALRTSGRVTLMIGDGVNDAPVLAAADVSMTVKGGAELANSTADLILTSDTLGLVTSARMIALRSRQLIRQNLTWAVVYNVSVLPLAVSGVLKPWMAALGMSLSSLLVVANASRLVRERRRGGAPRPPSRVEPSAS
jgi:Cu2+-exporting ATPase